MKAAAYAAAAAITFLGAAVQPALSAPEHNHGAVAQANAAQTHKTSGVVKKVDPATGKVTLAHGAVTTLNWPPMTMAFTVQDKSMLAKLPQEKKVEFEFQQRGSDYVITAVK